MTKSRRKRRIEAKAKTAWFSPSPRGREAKKDSVEGWGKESFSVFFVAVFPWCVVNDDDALAIFFTMDGSVET